MSTSAKNPVSEAEMEKAWFTLDTDIMKSQGGTLICALYEGAIKRGMTRKALAEELDIQATHLYQLANGRASITGVKQEFYERAAKFLNISIFNVKLMAGVIRYTDLFSDFDGYQAMIGPSIEFILKDANLGCLVPATLRDAPIEIQQLVVHLYERATGRKLMPARDDVIDVARATLAGHEVELYHRSVRLEIALDHLADGAQNDEQLERLDTAVMLLREINNTTQGRLPESIGLPVPRPEAPSLPPAGGKARKGTTAKQS